MLSNSDVNMTIASLEPEQASASSVLHPVYRDLQMRLKARDKTLPTEDQPVEKLCAAQQNTDNPRNDEVDTDELVLKRELAHLISKENALRLGMTFCLWCGEGPFPTSCECSRLGRRKGERWLLPHTHPVRFSHP